MGGGARKVHIEFCWGNMKERDHMEVLDGKWEDNINMNILIQ